MATAHIENDELVLTLSANDLLTLGAAGQPPAPPATGTLDFSDPEQSGLLILLTEDF